MSVCLPFCFFTLTESYSFDGVCLFLFVNVESLLVKGKKKPDFEWSPL